MKAAFHLALLCATAASVFFVFLIEQGGGIANPAFDEQVQASALFTFSVLLILGSHEMGHWAMAKAHGVDTSLPYFIPVPFGFGTLGAVIRLKGQVPNKNALVDIGAAGPLAGLAVAIPMLVAGTLLSHVDLAPVADAPFPSRMSLWSLASLAGQAARAYSSDVPMAEVPFAGYQTFGDSPLTLLITRMVVGAMPAGHDLFVHPVFIAGWFGTLVTMLNLMPSGQLDGGHLVHAWFGEKHATLIGHTVASVLLVLALFFSVSWLVWFFMITRVVGFSHPKVADDSQPLSRGRKITCVVCFVFTLLVFMPVPMGLL